LADQSLAGVAEESAALTRRWERHIIEVETGLPPGATSGATPRPEYDPATRTLQQRVAAKAEEVTADGLPASVITVQRMRRRHRDGGLRALVDGRSQRPTSPQGRADERVVDAIREALGGEITRSTGTRNRLRRRVEQVIKFATLLANCVIFHTVVDMTTVIRELIGEGWQITAEDLAVLSPYLTAHIQRFGVYATDEVALAPDAYNAHLGVELAAAAPLSADTAGD
jgi:hypothetical protein